MTKTNYNESLYLMIFEQSFKCVVSSLIISLNNDKKVVIIVLYVSRSRCRYVTFDIFEKYNIKCVGVTSRF